MIPKDILMKSEALVVPQFTPEEYALLKTFEAELPEGTDTLAERVQEFNTVKNDLATETKSNRRMPWIVAAIEISLIAATVLGFVFGGLVGLIPLFALLAFDIPIGLGSGLSSDTYAPPPFGAIFCITYFIKRQSTLEARHQALSQELPDAIRQTAQFWQEQGAALLEKVHKAAEDLSVEFPLVVGKEPLEEIEARLRTSLEAVQAARGQKILLEGISAQIQIGQQIQIDQE